jgi:hypothetical protein
MKRFVSILLLCATVGAVGAAEAAKGAAVNSKAVLAPAKRLEALKLASRVLAPRTPTWKTTMDLTDPFFRQNFTREEEKVVEVDPNAGKSERSDLEVLEAAANAQINPTGTMMVDGENYLLLGGKRYKTGAQLPVTLDGIVYPITISAIEGKSYTLRLNEQELRRQLK